MKKQKRINLFFALTLVFCCFLISFLSVINVAYALNIGVVGGYSDVLEDLQKDENFNADDYPLVLTDYSLKFITIAESFDKELFVYVYQPYSPNSELRATSINISLGYRLGKPENYSLKFVNSNGVFSKYLVKGLTISSESVRYYEVVSIFRNWNDKYDKVSDNGNTINEVSFKVAIQYTFETDGNEVLVSSSIADSIVITDNYVGLLRYTEVYAEQIGLGGSIIELQVSDNYFIAFNTDIDIDSLISADVSYIYQTATSTAKLNNIDLDEMDWKVKSSKDEKVTLNSDDTENLSLRVSNWKTKKYSWKKIQSVQDFISTENRKNIKDVGIGNIVNNSGITDEGLKDLQGKKWVLRFCLYDWDFDAGLIDVDIEVPVVSSVTILSLTFEKDGKTLRLGAIDNKRTSDGIPDNYSKTSFVMKDWFRIVLILIFVILLIMVLNPILPTIFNILWTVIKIVFKIIWWIISAPFKLINKLFKKRKERTDEKNE